MTPSIHPSPYVCGGGGIPLDAPFTATTATGTGTGTGTGKQELDLGALVPRAGPMSFACQGALTLKEQLADKFKLSGALQDLDSPAFVSNELLVDPSIRRSDLSMGGLRVLETINAGGASEVSEALSYEALSLCLQAKLLRTEMEIEYEDFGSITDYSVKLPSGRELGVSVTRAMHWDNTLRHGLGDVTEADVQYLLAKKLSGVLRSTERVCEDQAWERQILHILTTTTNNVRVLRQVWDTMPPAIKGNTIVLVTVCDYKHIYDNKGPLMAGVGGLCPQGIHYEDCQCSD